jgi:polycomb protein EED
MLCVFYAVQSCDNRVALWKPGKFTDLQYELTSNASTVSVLHYFEFVECDIWFMKFALDYPQKVSSSLH